MFSIKNEGPFMCTSCGYGSNSSVYKVYGNDGSTRSQLTPVTHLKLSECSNCHSEVDSYVELDSCLLMLDAFLLKTKFYRHVLGNCQFSVKTPIKLMIIFVLCNAYSKWIRSNSSSSLSYIDLEYSFYYAYATNFLEQAFLYSIILLLTTICYQKSNYLDTLSSLIICSYIQVLSVPATIWARDLIPTIDILLEIMFSISLVQCIRVKFPPNSILKSLILICVTKLLHHFTLQSIYARYSPQDK
ncbi:Protein ARV1 [Halotydeus destructor]|nr:Protein ARV1 [Halotydeus destructor]